MESGWHSELEPGRRGLDPGFAIHISCGCGSGPQPLSVKQEAGTPAPALVCADTSLNVPNAC